MCSGRGGGLGGRSRKLVRLSSISSMNKTGSPDSGSAHEPRYWMTLGCRRPLRNSISSWKRSTMRCAAGSRVWKRIGCRTLAAQTSWLHSARYTAPYDPIPSELSSDLTSCTSRKPKRPSINSCCAILREGEEKGQRWRRDTPPPNLRN